MRKFLVWLKASFEGPDGKASHKKFSVWILMLLYTLIILYSVVASFLGFEHVPSYALYSVESMALLFSGINTVQSIKQKKDNGNKQQDTD